MLDFEVSTLLIYKYFDGFIFLTALHPEDVCAIFKLIKVYSVLVRPLCKYAKFLLLYHPSGKIKNLIGYRIVFSDFKFYRCLICDRIRVNRH